jgi:PBP1b-binding outer membrane lipoprotein LpoB
MKKALFSVAVMALFTVGCSSNPEQEAAHEHGADTHQHEDEASSEDAHGHPHNEDGSHQQEEFTIDGDSVKVDKVPASHSHDGKQDHKH